MQISIQLEETLYARSLQVEQKCDGHQRRVLLKDVLANTQWEKVEEKKKRVSVYRGARELKRRD